MCGVIQSFADGLHSKADLPQTFVVENIAAVENVRRLQHQTENSFVVQLLENRIHIFHNWNTFAKCPPFPDFSPP